MRIFLILSFLFLANCSGGGGGNNDSSNSSIVGVWQQESVIGPNGQTFDASKEEFKKTATNGEFTYMHFEISKDIIRIHTLESESSGAISSSAISVLYSYDGNIIKTADDETLQVSDYEVLNVTDKKLTLKFLGEGDPISMVLSKTTKANMAATIEELSTKTIGFIPGITPAPTTGQLDNDPNIKKIKNLGVNVDIHYSVLRAEDIESLKENLPLIASSLSQYKRDVENVILTKAMTTSYDFDSASLIVSAQNSINAKIDIFLENNNDLIKTQEKTGFWIAGINPSSTKDVRASIEILKREKITLERLSSYIDKVKFHGLTASPEIRFSERTIEWPKPKKDTENSKYFSEAFSKAANSSLDAFGACNKVNFFTSAFELKSKKDAERAYSLDYGAGRNKNSLRALCDQFDSITFSNDFSSIPQNSSNIWIRTVERNNKRSLEIVLLLLLGNASSSDIDNAFKSLKSIGEFEQVSGAKFNIQNIGSNGYIFGADNVADALKLLKGQETAIKNAGVNTIEITAFGSVSLKNGVLTVPGYSKDDQDFQDKRSTLESLLN